MLGMTHGPCDMATAHANKASLDSSCLRASPRTFLSQRVFAHLLPAVCSALGLFGVIVGIIMSGSVKWK